MTCWTFALEKAGLDCWPIRYKKDKIVMTMRQYKEELITVAKKKRLRYVNVIDSTQYRLLG